MIKDFIKKNFESFAYFYSYLRYRIFILVILSIFIGVLDGFGLMMFLPLLQLVDDSSSVDSESLGNMRFLVDFLENMGFSLTLLTVLATMAFFFFAKGLVQYFSGIYKVNIQEWFISNLRVRNIFGLNKLAYKYFVVSDVGRIQNTLTGEIDRVAGAYFNYTKAFESFVLVVVYMAFAFYGDARFALIVSVGGVLTNFLYKSLYQKTKGRSRILTQQNNDFQSLVIQNVGNYKYLKATGSLERYGRKLREAVLKIRDSKREIGKLDALLSSGREPLLVIIVVSAIYIQTSLLGAELAPILLSLFFFYRALNSLIQMQLRWNKFLAISGSLENMVQFENELRENKDATGAVPVKEEVQTMELSNIWFYYGNTPVLYDISLEIKKHETIAFVGESGSGKTTLVNIVAGLLPPGEGSYRINSKESTELNMISFQEKIGYITQDPVIFGDTLFNNVTFWGEENEENKDKFWKAVEQAAIFDFVQELPNMENTVLGNNGVNLSGGQRQRISIARELYKQVEILILDEATSALDSETEKAIQNNIEELKGNYTLLIVAHRISTIKNADRIVVMKAGKIANVGSFNELVEGSSYFSKLVSLQEI